MFAGEGMASEMYNYARAAPRREIQSWIEKHAACSGRNKMYKTPPRTYIFIVLKQIVNVHTYMRGIMLLQSLATAALFVYSTYIYMHLENR